MPDAEHRRHCHHQSVLPGRVGAKAEGVAVVVRADDEQVDTVSFAVCPGSMRKLGRDGVIKDETFQPSLTNSIYHKTRTHYHLHCTLFPKKTKPAHRPAMIMIYLFEFAFSFSYMNLHSFTLL